MTPHLLAGTLASPHVVGAARPTILVFDSGLGGLTVFTELKRARPDARFIYAADSAAFPYGALSEPELLSRVVAVIRRLIAIHAPDIVVVACNTASTLVLPRLRERFDIPFVGTVPAIKPAAALSVSKMITVLATPGTVRRDYTRGLIETYAGGCRVELVGSTRLAALAEAELSGNAGPDYDVLAEIAPCFLVEGGKRTDAIVLACTHYPLLLARFQQLAPWPVTWVDPAPAIAKRTAQILGSRSDTVPDGPRTQERLDGLAVFTGAVGLDAALRSALFARGLNRLAIEPMPLRPAPGLT